MIGRQEILLRPLLTEKNTKLQELQNKYAFEVHPKASKIEVEKEIKKRFPKITVLGVSTLIVRGKTRRVGKHFGKRKNWKKAIVTLKSGDKLEYFEGL